MPYSISEFGVMTVRIPTTMASSCKHLSNMLKRLREARPFVHGFVSMRRIHSMQLAPPWKQQAFSCMSIKRL